MVEDTAPKYARPERERRFLFRAPPRGVVVRTVRIVDRYLPGTRLRLRAATEVDRTTYKLTQKVPAPDGGPGLITTLYLTPAEHALLSEVPAATLRKTRLSLPPLGVDVFEDELTGLVLGEAEFDDDDSMTGFPPPTEAIAEVTRDQRLSGGRLAMTSAAELAATLRAYGIDL